MESYPQVIHKMGKKSVDNCHFSVDKSVDNLWITHFTISVNLIFTELSTSYPQVIHNFMRCTFPCKFEVFEGFLLSYPLIHIPYYYYIYILSTYYTFASRTNYWKGVIHNYEVNMPKRTSSKRCLYRFKSSILKNNNANFTVHLINSRRWTNYNDWK